MAFDEDAGQTIVSGMGELHLDIYVERMRREYKVAVEVGQPRVNYREAITRKATFDYLHKKQSGEAPQPGSPQPPGSTAAADHRSAHQAGHTIQHTTQ